MLSIVGSSNELFHFIGLSINNTRGDGKNFTHLTRESHVDSDNNNKYCVTNQTDTICSEFKCFFGHHNSLFFLPYLEMN